MRHADDAETGRHWVTLGFETTTEVAAERWNVAASATLGDDDFGRSWDGREVIVWAV